MSILKVARMGHPVLRERARPVEPAELKHVLLQKLIDDMVETMHEYHGVGLAAPQVHEDIRIFVALLEEDPGPKSEATAIVNPEIVPVGDTKIRRLGGLPQHPRHPRHGAALDRHHRPRAGSARQGHGDSAQGLRGAGRAA